MILLWKSSLNYCSRLFAASNVYTRPGLPFHLTLITARSCSNSTGFMYHCSTTIDGGIDGTLNLLPQYQQLHFVDWSNSQVLFLVQEQSYCCRHFQLHCGDKFYCRTKLSFDHGSHTSTSTSTFSTKHPDSTDPEPDI